MKILVLNTGSSSIKCTLYEMPERRVVADGKVERIGDADATLTFDGGDGATSGDCDAPDHRRALQVLLRRFLREWGGVLDSLDEIGAFGHRVVHGGETSHSCLVDDDVLRIIRENSALAPLHNPPNLAGLEAAMAVAPKRPQVAVFDTAFHSAMPPEAYMYAVPYSLYEDYKVRAYGFHGTSHRYVAARAAELLGRAPEDTNLITIHLGNGCSMAAVRGGRSVDASMGLTPLQGLVMGTRSGDVDPALFVFLCEWLKIGPTEVADLLNRQSGMLGLSGLSNDSRDLLEAAAAGHERAQLALDVFHYRIRKYIGSYFAVLGRVDAIAFTAGIGENCAETREATCAGLEGLGIVLDPRRNIDLNRAEGDVSTDDSPVKVLIVPTNEALQIALETYEIIQKEAIQ